MDSTYCSLVVLLACSFYHYSSSPSDFEWKEIMNTVFIYTLHDVIGLALLVLLVLTFLGIWIYGLIWAALRKRKFNKQKGARK